jgi:hypothetical protein
MTSARISWTLPPEELFDAAYIPSLWAVWKMALLALLAAVLGPLSINDFIQAGPEVHRALANAPRKATPKNYRFRSPLSVRSYNSTPDGMRRP